MTEKLTKREQTHLRMLEAAGREFRSNGYAGIGVDGVAKAAGVTSGAFYAHFGSKDGAFKASVSAGLDEVIEAVPTFQREHGSNWVRAFADYYLGKPHRDDLASGCAMTTLSPEVVRASPALQTLYEEKMHKIASLMAQGLANGSDRERIARAWAMLGTLIGGLTIARAVHDNTTAQQIADALAATAIVAAFSRSSSLRSLQMISGSLPPSSNAVRL